MRAPREQVLVNEVGLRDGLQNHAAYVPVASKLELLQALRGAGLRSFEATSFVNPRLVPQMADADDLCARLPRDHDVTFSALVPNQRGLARALKAGIHCVAVVMAASDTFNLKNVGMSFERTRAEAIAVIAAARANGIAAKAYVATAFDCPFEGPIAPQIVCDIADRMLAAGADEVVVADTIGSGSPSRARTLIAMLVQRHGAERIAVHFHDTRAQALTLAWIALDAGIRKFDSSIGGLGGCPFAPGASGNLATEDLVFMLEDNGFDTGVRVASLPECVDIASRITGRTLGGRILPWHIAHRIAAARKPGGQS